MKRNTKHKSQNKRNAAGEARDQPAHTSRADQGLQRPLILAQLHLEVVWTRAHELFKSGSEQ